MTPSRGNLNLTVFVARLLREVAINKTPTVPAAGVYFFSASGSYFNKPPLRFGDGAAKNRRVIKKTRIQMRADTQRPPTYRSGLRPGTAIAGYLAGRPALSSWTRRGPGGNRA